MSRVQAEVHPYPGTRLSRSRTVVFPPGLPNTELYLWISVMMSRVGLFAIKPPSRKRFMARKKVGAAPVPLAALHTCCSETRNYKQRDVTSGVINNYQYCYWSQARSLAHKLAKTWENHWPRKLFSDSSPIRSLANQEEEKTNPWVRKGVSGPKPQRVYSQINW